MHRASARPAPSNSHLPSQKLPCPVCDTKIAANRPQDLHRHLLRHFPSWIACSSAGCTWKGYRLDAFGRHSYGKHQSTTATPGRHGYYQLYYPRPLVEAFTEGSISFGDAKQRAMAAIEEVIEEVEGMTLVHCKQQWLEVPSVRRGKKSSRR
jgi:hypothetical protein